jgi:hypothetical protein
MCKRDHAPAPPHGGIQTLWYGLMYLLPNALVFLIFEEKKEA